MKTHIDYLQASSLRGLLETVNHINEKFPNNPILKDDIVSIQKGEENYILLYYK